jgi:hypothetical protein
MKGLIKVKTLLTQSIEKLEDGKSIQAFLILQRIDKELIAIIESCRERDLL